MKSFIFLVMVACCGKVLAQDIPLKPKEDFEIKLDYKFKQRPLATSKIEFQYDEQAAERERRTGGSSVLPYLILKITMLKLDPEEAKVRITNSKQTGSIVKKVSLSDSFEIDMGFTDDMKDRVSPHEYQLTFVTSKKKEISKVTIFVEEDGTFLVNNEKRGKF